MRFLTGRFGLVLAAVWLCLAAASPAKADDREDVEAAFAAIQRAVQASDAATLETLIEPDYRFYHGLGEVDTREAYLAKVREGRLARQRAGASEHEPALRLFGDTAVRSWIIHFRRTEANLDDWGRGTAVLVRRDGQWRLASQQTSALFWISPMVPAANLSAFAGTYAAPNRSFEIVDRGTYLTLRYTDGADAYAFPAAGDAFGMGGGIMLHFERGPVGAVARAIRRDGEREIWRAERVTAESAG